MASVNCSAVAAGRKIHRQSLLRDLPHVSIILLLTLLSCGCPRQTADVKKQPPLPTAEVTQAVPPAVPSVPAEGAVSVPAAETEVAPENRQAPPAPLKKPRLLVTLPQELCNTPDAMCLLPDGNVLLSVPNFNDPSRPPCILKIKRDNQVELFLELPVNPHTGKPFGAMGICVAPNGDLFIADNQGERGKSRVCRIRMDKGLPVEIGPAVEGFNVANAVLCYGGYLFVTDTQIDAERYPALSGVFRFRLADLDQAVIVLAEDLLHDPHLIAVLETYDKTMPLGANGMCVDDAGNLYVGNVFDGTVHRIRFDEQGNVVANEIFAKADFMKSADGLFYDPVRKVIYVADPRVNAVHRVHLDGRVELLAQNGDTDGHDGSLDMPVEVLVRENELIVSNLDMPFPGCINSAFDPPATLSVIDLD